MGPHPPAGIQLPALGQTQLARENPPPFGGGEDSNRAGEWKLVRPSPGGRHDFACLSELPADLEEAYDNLLGIREGVDLQVRSLDTRMPLREQLLCRLVALRDLIH